MRTLSIALTVALALPGCSDSRGELMQELADPSPVKRSGALRTLCQETDEEAYRLITQALEDRSAVVRIAAVQALAEFRGRDTTAALVRATQDADPEVRITVVSELAGRGDQAVVRQALMGMLLRGEPNLQVRKKIYTKLERLGSTGARLAEEMAALQMEMIRREWDDSRCTSRAQLVRTAGRSIHPDGMEIVLKGLADPDADVILSALSVLDGRGGKEVRRRLLLLASDQDVEVRLGVVRALREYNREGAAILQGRLRDHHPKVRLDALEQLLNGPSDVDPEIVCPWLQDMEEEVALRAAEWIGTKGFECDLAPLVGGLKEPQEKQYRRTLQVLSRLGGKPARAVLAREMEVRPAGMRPELAAALAGAGDRRPELGRMLQKELNGILDGIGWRSESWVGGKLPPRQEPNVTDEGQSKLSDEELKKLYEKYDLPPAGKDSPRGVADILAAFPELSKTAPARELFEPATTDEVEQIARLVDGLVVVDASASSKVIDRALRLTQSGLVGQVARVLHRRGVKVHPDRKLLDHLGKLLYRAQVVDAEAIAQLIGDTQERRAAEVLSEEIGKLPWEKRESIAEVLGEMKLKEGVGPLIALLTGYSVASAARSLGQIGDPSAIEPLKKALQHAGPSAEMDILMALAKLGCKDIVVQLAEKLRESDPEVRRAAVGILGIVGGPEAMQLLQIAKFDLDRLVRKETGDYLNRRQPGRE